MPHSNESVLTQKEKTTDIKLQNYKNYKTTKKATKILVVNKKLKLCFSNKIYGSNFIKQHSETAIVRHFQNADCRSKNIFIGLFIIIFGTRPSPLTFCN